MSENTPFLLRAWNKLHQREENIESSYNALKTISQEQERTDNGKMFHFSQVTSVGSSASVTMFIQVNSNIAMHLNSLSMKCSVGPVEGSLYESPYIDPTSRGTGFRPVNLNRAYSSDTSVQSFYLNCGYDVNSLGTEIGAGAIVESAGGSTKSISGEASNKTTEWILAPGKGYLLLITNDAASQGLLQNEISFYEVDS